MIYTPIIGLEVHIEQDTLSKMFCSCSADHFAQVPNTQVCPVCLGLPGALPMPNKQAILNTLRFGAIFGCKLSDKSKFDRKHYSYPDLPKGYQISQYDMPLCTTGSWEGSSDTHVHIKRIHLEEDTGKLVHSTLSNGKKVSLVDFNRSGVPLIELVTDPDFRNGGDIDEFLKEVQSIVRTLGISTADMEKGSMRLEANVSITHDPTQLPNYKVELKNINSFRFLRKAIDWEIGRQTSELEAHGKLVQETRGYNELTGRTFSQRSKEEAQDYRYFPEPDIPPLVFAREELESIVEGLPMLPSQKKEEYKNKFNLSESYARQIAYDKKISEYFEKAVGSGMKHGIEPREIAGVIVNKNLHQKFPEPSGLVRKLIELTRREYATESEVRQAIKIVIESNKKAVEEYKEGKHQVLGFLIGQVQAELKGRGDPKEIQKLLVEIL